MKDSVVQAGVQAGFSLEDWQIRLLLQHRAPILQLDRVDHCAPMAGVLHASKAVAGGDTMLLREARLAYLAPGALIEALAQCCGLLVRLRWLQAEGADLEGFAGGDAGQLDRHDIPRSVLAESQVRFSGRLGPGQVLRLTTRLVLSRGDMHRFDATMHGVSGPRSDLMEAVSAQIMLKFPYNINSQ